MRLSDERKMIAQKEIAKMLGLSAVTVSRALRNHPDLAQETRERILQKARELGYSSVKNDGDRQGVKRLGILLYERDPEKDQEIWSATAEVPRRILAEIQKEALKNHGEVVLETPSSEALPLMIRNRSVDGVIVMGRYAPEALNHLRGIPALSVGNYVTNDWLPRIVSDNFRGMSLATEHLISLGHRKILFLGAEDGDCWGELHRERANGYRFAMQSHGLPSEIVHSGWNLTPWTEKLLQQTAIVASSDSLALPLQDLLRENGKVLPRDCSLVGFDGNYQSVNRKLTTYVPDWGLMGKMAVDCLLHRPGNLEASGIEMIIPGRLIVRDSSQAPQAV